jgi:hypothetical protein
MSSLSYHYYTPRQRLSRQAQEGRRPGRALLSTRGTRFVSAVHRRWEWRSTRALQQQLLDLRQAGAMTVDLAYFVVPVAQRLRKAGVEFDITPRHECPDDRQLTLLSVCTDYPGAVRICLADPGRAAQPRGAGALAAIGSAVG